MTKPKLKDHAHQSALTSTLDTEAQSQRALIDQLREIGLGRFIELPRIAVVGDTSTGKSSLLSALSSITFPSAREITTRCPTQLVLSRSSTFCGSVRLHRFNTGTKPSKKDKLERELAIDCIEQVPEIIERITKLLVAEGQLISDDKILIQISGPGLPDLTLTDLPGLVRNVGDHEDSGMIGQVRDMVLRYMKEERTVILAVVPADVDVHNTEILRLALEADPSGDRTIAVVTKMDRVQPGDEPSVLNLVLNKVQHVKYGYHAVRCRSQKDVDNGVTIEEARQSEEAFMNKHDFWNRLPVNMRGVRMLCIKLVDILHRIISRSMPEVLQQITERLELTETELKRLGTPPASALERRLVLGKAVDRLTDMTSHAIRGNYDQLSMLQSDGVNLHLRAMLWEHELAFKKKIEATADIYDRDSGVEVDEDVLVNCSGNWKRAIVKAVDGDKIQCEEFKEWYEKSSWKPQDRSKLKLRIRRNRGDELAIFPSYLVFTNLIQNVVMTWQEPTMELITKVEAQLEVVVNHIIEHLGMSKRMTSTFKSTAADVLTELTDHAVDELERLIEEERRPYTQQDELFEKLNRLRRESQPITSLLPALHDYANHYHNQRIYDDEALVKVLGQSMLLSEDQHALEMEMTLKAYVAVAIPRFVDKVPMRLQGLLLAPFVHHLKERLHSLTSDELQDLFHESQEVSTHRKHLEDKAHVFKRARTAIRASALTSTLDAEAQAQRVLIDQLRQIGLGRFIELPRIAVVGDTSTGKSSLLSALSSITFPSAREITTRCPTQLVLSRSDVFRGSVRLHRFNIQAKPGTTPKQDQLELEQAIDSIEQVPEIIERITKLLVAEGQLISDDKILIQISGPGLPDLTLTDLPGLVRNVGDHEDSGMIGQVRDMVLRYMKEERTVILAVVPADVDVHNTEILRLALEADPSGDRTIAVVTKMDRVQPGDEPSVLNLVLNKVQHVKYGYHAVRCRSQKDVDNGVTIEEARQSEEAFMNKHDFWNRLPVNMRGVRMLCIKLVDILHRIISRSMPEVLQQITENLELAEAELKRLGAPPASGLERRLMLGKTVNQVTELMSHAIRGNYDQLAVLKTKGVNLHLRAVLWEYELAFKTNVEASADIHERDSDIEVGEDVLVDRLGEWEAAVVKKVSGESIQCEGSEEWLDNEKWMPAERSKLKLRIRRNRGDELAIFPSYLVFTNLIQHVVKTWQEPTMELTTKVAAQLKAVVDRIIEHFGMNKRITNKFKNTAAEVLAELTDKVVAELERLIQEERRPYTQQDELFDKLNRLRIESQENVIRENLIPALHNYASHFQAKGVFDDNTVVSALGQSMLSGEEQHALEMELTLKAYLAVAIPRFVDKVPMRLQGLLLEPFVHEFKERLLSLTNEELQHLFHESNEIVTHRQELEEKVRVLKSARTTIRLVA
ncbi:TPA: hypothetical protein N0F65_007941 [Lagenidium giganteum]|uniref:Uncharacterized protein n=1 Tax=Lagenidium giganteum TaxID=4803 RepID=A0AAV2YLB6_9STRA|nr:TPA: hypothetical protein N0F65_007941 [Lagenidium giganteum]